jgi:hypothetical protein
MKNNHGKTARAVAVAVQRIVRCLLGTINHLLKRLNQFLASFVIIIRFTSDGGIAIFGPHNLIKRISIKIAYALLVYGAIIVAGTTEAIAANPPHGSPNPGALISDRISSVGMKLDKNLIGCVPQTGNQNIHLRMEQRTPDNNVAPTSENVNKPTDSNTAQELYKWLSPLCGLLGCLVGWWLYDEIGWHIDNHDRHLT